MQDSPAATAASAAAQLQHLREAAVALSACTADAAGASPNSSGAVLAANADWESRLAAVNAKVAVALRPSSSGSPHGSSGGSGGAGLAPHQAELVEAINSCPGNCVTFLPLGLGLREVTDAVLSSAAARHPDRHVLVVVDRPAQALSHAQRLRAELGLPTAVFCGGDFLYSFPQQFESSRVLVFTAGLLLRLLKTGVYRLEQAALMVLLDAFTAVRNHPSNTLVREYWKVADEEQRPRVLGVLASQLPTKPRPFDRLRQNLRKLCHSLQAQLLLPAGPGLAALESQLHHDRIQLHSYAPPPPEEALASQLQQHLLGLWDVLHEFGLNHFGRLVQFSSTTSSGVAAGTGGTPGTPSAGSAAAGTPPAPGIDHPVHGLLAGIAAASNTPTPPRMPAGASPLSAKASPAAEASPATPLSSMLGASPQHGSSSSAAAAAAEQPDPMQHDWAQVELQVVHSLWHSNALPSKGEHVREPDALALMMHVLDCVRALRLLLEQGPAACLARLPAALHSLAAFLEEGLTAQGPLGGGAPSPLKCRILQVAAASPLLHWALQQPVSEERPCQMPSKDETGDRQQAGDRQQQTGSLTSSSSPQPPSTPAVGRGSGVAPAAAAVGCARSAALVELLGELALDCQLSGRRRQVAVVAGTADSVQMLQQLLTSTASQQQQQLAGVDVHLFQDALLHHHENGKSSPRNCKSHLASAGEEAVLGPSDSAGSDSFQTAPTAAGWLELAPEGADNSTGAAEAEDDGASLGDKAAAAGGGDGEGVELAIPHATAPAPAEPASQPPSPFAGPSSAEPAATGEQASTPKALAAAEAAGKAAAPAQCGGSMAVHLLAASELAELERHIAAYQILVWYSSGDVLHASCQELDSAALSACHKLSAAAVAAQDEAGDGTGEGPGLDGGSPLHGGQRLECHVLATASQVLALGEVRRVDHALKAAMQLVLLGDAAAEEKLTMLAHRNTAAVLEEHARTVLDTLCLGLCGTAPSLATMTASPAKLDRRGSARLRHESDRHERVTSEETGAVENGGQCRVEAPQAAAETAPQLLFQSSVTLPSAYFPPERFHTAGVSMPLDVFVGPPLPSEQQAANAAALLALAALHRLGIVARYWPSRLLLAQHLLPRSMQGQHAMPTATALGLAQQQSPPPPLQAGTVGGGSSPATTEGVMGAAVGGQHGQLAAAGPGGGPGAAFGSGAGAPPHVMNFFCPLCNVAATGHKAFEAHLKGFRHQRRIKQAQVLQQGQEVDAMLQGLLLDEANMHNLTTGVAGGGAGAMVLEAREGAPPLALRRTGRELQEEEEGGEYGSPSFADRQVYSPDPTPYRCDACGVYCTSLRLLEAHIRGRKHQRRMAGMDSPGSGNRPASPKSQPLVTPWFCSLCGLYATSEEQLQMHMLGKRHTRMMHLQRQRGALLGGAGAAVTAGGSLQHQQHQLLTAAVAAASWASNGTSPFAAAAAAGWLTGGGPPSGSSTPPTGSASPLPGSASPLPLAGGSWSAEEQSAILHGMLLDGAGNQRIYRCDLCGVVTPSKRHYEYHLQGVKHTRRLLRAQGLDPGSASQPGTPASCGSPMSGSRSASPVGRGGRGRHSRHGSADWGSPSASGAADPPPESLICSVCGIMATSAVNLEDHYKGRRHQKNVERQQAQEAAAAAAIARAASASSGQLPPLPPNVSPDGGPFASAAAVAFPSASATSAAGTGAPNSGGGATGNGGGLSLQRSTSGITLGADGLRLGSGALLSAGSLQRLPSGDVLDGFPCVRIGDVLLPSSMDLRAFLEEMQHLDEADEEADQLPPIAEHQEQAEGGGGTIRLEPAGSTTHLATPVPPASGRDTWAYSSNNTSPISASISTKTSPGTAAALPASGWGSGGGSWAAAGAAPPTNRRGQGGSNSGSGSRMQPASPPFHSFSGGGGGSGSGGGGANTGGYNRPGSRPGSAGSRLSRFAQDQQHHQHVAGSGVGSSLAYDHGMGVPGGGAGYSMQSMQHGYGMGLGMRQQPHMAGTQPGYGGGGSSYSVPPDYSSAGAMLAAQQAAHQAAFMQQAAALQMQQMQMAAVAYGGGLPGMGGGYGGMPMAQQQPPVPPQQQQAYFPQPSLPSQQQGRAPPGSSRYQY